jgi:hypothetical protein
MHVPSFSDVFLCHYGTETLNTTVTGADEKTFRKWFWLVVVAISNLHAEVIVWNNRLNGATRLLPIHWVSVDGSHCPIQKVSPFWSGWKSFKRRGAAVCNEVCLSISQGFIVWVNRRLAQSHFFHCHLLTELEDGEKLLADDGYPGRDRYVTISNRFELDEVKKNIKARQEQINSRFKNYYYYYYEPPVPTQPAMNRNPPPAKEPWRLPQQQGRVQRRRPLLPTSAKTMTREQLRLPRLELPRRPPKAPPVTSKERMGTYSSPRFQRITQVSLRLPRRRPLHSCRRIPGPTFLALSQCPSTTSSRPSMVTGLTIMTADTWTEASQVMPHGSGAGGG